MTKPIGIELFAHINNDVFIAGTRNLEGRPYRETIAFLQDFLNNEAKTFLPPDLLKEQAPAFSHLGERLSALLQTSREFEGVDKIDVKPLVERILALHLKEDKSVLMPGGWLGTTGGHAIVYEFKKDKNGNLIFMLYNSGAGLDYHPFTEMRDKRRYQTLKCYKIPKKFVTQANLTYFINQLNRAQSSKNRATEQRNADFLYQEIFPAIEHLEGKEIEPEKVVFFNRKKIKKHLSMPQRAGTCAEKSLHELVKNDIPSPHIAKWVIFSLKVYSIELFLKQEQAKGLSLKSLNQLKDATSNLAGIVLKQKDIPQAIAQRAESVIKQVSELSSASFEVASQTNVDPILPTTLRPKIFLPDSLRTIVPRVSDQHIIKKPFNLDNTDYVSAALDSKKLSVDKLSIFVSQMKDYFAKGYYPDTEAAIFKYLTTIPLEETYYSELTTEKAVEYLDNIHKLLALYAEASMQNSGLQLSPEKIGAILGVLNSTDWICKNKNLSIYPTGLDAFIIHYNQSKNTYSYFKNNSHYTPYLSTGSNTLDERLKKILAINNVSPGYIDVNCIVSYLQKNKALNAYLTKLYQEHTPNSLFDGKDRQAISQKNYEAMIAYLHFFEDKPGVFIEEANKVTILKKTVSLINKSNESFKNFSLANFSKVEKQPEKLVTILYGKNDVHFIHSCIASGMAPPNPEEIVRFFGKIQDQRIEQNLRMDVSFPKDGSREVNKVFVYADGLNVNSQHSPLSQELRHLRLVPDLQFLTTVDFFSSRLELFSKKQGEERLQDDLKIYLRMNLLQPGVIIQALKLNPKALEYFNQFIDQAVLYFDEDLDSQLYFYQLQTEINHYVLNINVHNDPNYAGLKRYIEQIQMSLFRKLSVINLKEGTTLESYTLSKVKLQIKLGMLSSQKLDLTSAKTLFLLFMDFSQNARECNLDSSELVEQHRKLKEAVLQELFVYKDALYEWALEKYSADNDLKLSHLVQTGSYPYYFAVNEKEEPVLSIDLVDGQILSANAYYTNPPPELVNSEIGKEVLRRALPKLLVTVCRDDAPRDPNARIDKNSVLFKQYDIVGSDPKERFFNKSGVWYYQKEITLENKKRFFEKKDIHRKASTFSLNRNGDDDLPKLGLTESFYGKETTYWSSGSDIVIERGDKRYLIEDNAIVKDKVLSKENILQELNTQYQKTGFVWVKTSNWFAHFEHPDFIEVFVNNKGEPRRAKINFLRYDIELEGHFNSAQNKWIFHLKDKPELELIDSAQLRSDDMLAHSLVFENTQTKERIVYTPNQYFYVDIEEKAKAESDFQSAYYTPILDTTQVHKRNRLGLGVPELNIWPNSIKESNYPEGLVSYKLSEKYFTYKLAPNTKVLTADSSHAKLYLAYLNLIHHKPEEALAQIQALTQEGGLKGTLEELEVIHKILKGAPELAKKITHPKVVAVQTHLLHACSELLSRKKDFNVPLKNTMLGNTPDHYIVEEHYKMLRDYQDSMGEVITENLELYNNIRVHIPLGMQLSLEKEHQLFSKNSIQKGGNVQLKARYFELKRVHWLRLKNKILQSGRAEEPKYKKRLADIDKVLSKQKKVPTQIMELGIITQEIELDVSLKNEDVKKGKASKINLKLDMSDEEFLEQLNSIYNVAQSQFHWDRRKLKTFLAKTLKASCHTPKDKQKSIIPKWAAVLWVVMHSPSSFSNAQLDNIYTESVAQRAKKIQPILRVKVVGYIPKKGKPLDVTPLGKTDDKYLLPMPIVISKNDSLFSEFNYDNFIYATKLVEFNKEIESLRTQSQQKISTLKADLKKVIADKPYIDTNDQLIHCDEQIGHLKNETEAQIYGIIQKYLGDSNLRGQIFLVVENWLGQISDKKKSVYSDILTLANKGPKDPNLLARYQLEITAGMRQPLKINDLNRLFVLADLNEYRKATGLESDEAIQQLHDKMAQFVHFSILKTHYKKLKKTHEALESNPTPDLRKLADFGRVLLEKNEVPYTDSGLQFFQKAEKILMRPMQIEAFNKLVHKNANTNEFDNTVVQLIMGAGKSKVIAPTTALRKATGFNLVIQQVKSSLLQVSYADECARCHRLYNRIPYLFKFERQGLEFKKRSEFEHLNSRKWKQLYYDLQNVMLEKNFIMTSGTSLQSLELQYLDTLDQTPPLKEEEYKEWQKQIKILEKLLTLIQFYGDRNIDEIHEELDPIKELNYVIGLPKTPSPADINLHMDLYFFLRQIPIDSIVTSNKNLSAYTVVLDNTVLSDPINQIEKIMEAIAKGLVENQSLANPLYQILYKLKLNENDRSDLIQYLLNKKRSDKVASFLDKLTTEEKHRLFFIKFEVSKILPFTLLKNYNENYGASRLPEFTELQKRLAIPYIAINTPNESSRFGQFVESLNYTFQMNVKEPFSDALIESLIQSYLLQAKEERIIDPQLAFAQTEASQNFNRIFCKDIYLNNSSVSLEKISHYSALDLKELIGLFKTSENFHRAILSEKIMPLVKMNPSVLSSDSQDLGGMTNTTQGMSATPSNYRCYPAHINFDEIDSLGTDGETIDVLKTKNTAVIVSEKTETTETFFREAMHKCSQRDKVRALIEVGGLLKNENSNLEIVKKIDKVYREDFYALSENIKYILYFDESNNQLYALDRRTQAVVFVGNSDEKEVAKILGCAPSERFTYYDQARITGTDIAQMSDAHALVTLSEKTTLTQCLQGVKRLRQFTQDQSATLIQPNYTTSQAEPNVQAILKFLRKNEANKALSNHLKAFSKKFNSLIRRDLLNKIYNTQEIKAKAKLLQLFRSVFVKDTAPDDFTPYSHVTTEVDSQAYFEQLRVNTYDKWVRLCKEGNIELSIEEKAKMDKMMEEISLQAVEACDKKVSSINDLGTECENETEQELETELELEKQATEYSPLFKPNDLDPDFILALSPTQKFISNLKKAAFYFYNFFVKFVSFILYPIKKFFFEPDSSHYISINRVSPNSELISPNTFDSNLLLSSKQVWTLINGEQRGNRLKVYHNAYVKPIHVAMMVAPKNNPDALECTILTVNEADWYIKNGNEALAKKYPSHFVWLVSPNNTVLGGNTPSTLPKSYNRLLEQIRFINGDIKALVYQKEPLDWLSENSHQKMKFLKNNILPHFPENARYYNALKKKLSNLEKTQKPSSLFGRVIKKTGALSILNLFGGPQKEASASKSKPKNKVKRSPN